MFRPISRATVSTKRRSVLPSSAAGVPTAMKTTSADWIASAVSEVKESRPAFTLRVTRSSSPGS